MRLQNISDDFNPLDSLGSLSLSSPHRVLIVGCAYGGISALVNLLDLAQGKPRDTVYPVPDLSGRKSKNGVEITVIDERDGYCKCQILSTTFMNPSNICVSPRCWRTPGSRDCKTHFGNVEAVFTSERTSAIEP